MVMQTTLRFGEAVNKRDLSGFRDTTANAFRQAFSLERFNLSFRGFIEQSMDLTVVRNLEPAITETNFNSAQGTQRLAGTFPTRPSQLRFDYTFQWEDDSWKVAGIDLAVVPVE
ncbi:MAG: hypothetical protein KDH88_19835 [Chromatiales bacterium]|nr:hypothetical protein [Chromatiales bacterium]